VRVLLASNQPFHARTIDIEAGHGAGHLFDATRLAFVSPLDLVALASWSSALRLDGSKVRVVLPGSADVCRYLIRMDLLSHMTRAGVELVGQHPVIRRSDRADVLLEVRRVADAGDAERFAADAYELLARHIQKTDAGAAAKMLGELLDNAITHAESNTGAFAAAQVHLRSRDLQLAVADCGIGVRSHLARNPKFRGLTAPEALEAALKAGVSGTPESRGNGLPDLLELTSDYGGQMLLRSDDGHALVTTTNTRRYVLAGTPVPGTWAWVRIGLPRSSPGKIT
jgi:anti-sigma regulatory factor (Ser/Thr protein kinase)